MTESLHEGKVIDECRMFSGMGEFSAVVLVFGTVVTIVAYAFSDGIWTSWDWCYGLILLWFVYITIGACYVRRLELNELGYFEQASIGRWVLWSEEYAHHELRPFTVKRLSTDDYRNYAVCLNPEEGEFRWGMSRRKEDAENLCERLNRLLTHYQQNKSVRAAAGRSRNVE